MSDANGQAMVRGGSADSGAQDRIYALSDGNCAVDVTSGSAISCPRCGSGAQERKLISAPDALGGVPFYAIRCTQCAMLRVAPDDQISARLQAWVNSENDRTLVNERLMQIIEALVELREINARMEQSIADFIHATDRMNWPNHGSD